mgnify:CR=1 FL=1
MMRASLPVGTGLFEEMKLNVGNDLVIEKQASDSNEAKRT